MCSVVPDGTHTTASEESLTAEWGVNNEGFIIDGAFVTAKNKKEALQKYLIMHPYAKTDKCVYDKYTVERA